MTLFLPCPFVHSDLVLKLAVTWLIVKAIYAFGARAAHPRVPAVDTRGRAARAPVLHGLLAEILSGVKRTG